MGRKKQRRGKGKTSNKKRKRIYLRGSWGRLSSVPRAEGTASFPGSEYETRCHLFLCFGEDLCHKYGVWVHARGSAALYLESEI